jgi:hypothetical protein
MNAPDRLRLCKPCAERMRGLSSVRRIEELSKIGRNQKITCEQCGRRRYGYVYSVVFGAVKRIEI